MRDLNPDEAYKRRMFANKFGKIIALKPYTKLDKKLRFQCLVCFNIFKMTPRLLAKTKQPCLHCATPRISFTKGQRLLARYLKRNFNFSDKQLRMMFDIKKPLLTKLLKKVDGKIKKKSGIVVMGLDPATTNFGVSVIKINVNKDGSLKDAFCLESRLLINTFSTLNNLDFNTKFAKMSNELQTIADNWKPDILIMERFQSRGGFSSSSNEIVNLMISRIVADFKNIVPITNIVPPSGWKKRVNTIFNLKSEYKRVARRLPPHLLDASLICLSVFPEPKNPFFWLKDLAVRDKFIVSIYHACWQMGTMEKLDPGCKTPYNNSIPF